MADTSSYTSVVSPEVVQDFIAEKRKFSIDTGSVISRAFDFAKENIGATLITGLLVNSAGIIAPWLQGGISMGMYDEQVKGKKFEIDSQFRGFDFGTPILMNLIYTFLISFAVLIIPLAIFLSLIVGLESTASTTTGDSDSVFFVMMIIFYASIFLISIIVHTLLAFSINLIVFTGMDAWDAIKASASLARRNFITMVIFVLATGIVALLGVLACFVGIFFTYPMMFYAYYYAFADIFDLEAGTDEDNSILQHLV